MQFLGAAIGQRVGSDQKLRQREREYRNTGL